MAKLDDLLKLMVKQNASDLHLSSGAVPYLRIHGHMVELNSGEISHDYCQKLIFEILTENQIDEFKKRRDMVVRMLNQADGISCSTPEGAFYVFPQVPDGGGTGTYFIARAVENELLIIPGGIFSGRDTHFRISYAASDATIERGLEVLRRLARRGEW